MTSYLSKDSKSWEYTNVVSLDDICKLGDPVLREKCVEVQREEIPSLYPIVRKMGELIKLFNQKYGKGRGIAAPQIGLPKRLVVLNIDEPIAIINPSLRWIGNETFEVWDDCMSFPSLLVKVHRYRKCHLTFRNIHWEEKSWFLEGDMSELLQHECDHLDGVLAIDRAIDKNSYRYLEL